MEDIGLVLSQYTRVMMGILLDLLAGEEELARIQELGMDILNIAIVNVFNVPSYHLTTFKYSFVIKRDAIKLLSANTSLYLSS